MMNFEQQDCVYCNEVYRVELIINNISYVDVINRSLDLFEYFCILFWILFMCVGRLYLNIDVFECLINGFQFEEYCEGLFI